MLNSMFNQEGSIRKPYASASHGGAEACSRTGAAGKDSEVEPTEVVVEVLRGDAAVAAEERLNLLVPAVNGLDVQVAADPFAGRQVERLMADAEGGGAGRVAGAAVGDQQGVLFDNRPQNLLESRGIDRRQDGADGGTGAATRTGTCSCERPRFWALPPRLRGLRSRLRSPLRLASTKVSSASTMPRSVEAPPFTAPRKRWRQRNAVLTATSQRSADSLTVSPTAKDWPKSSQRSLWCSPDSGVPVRAPKVLPQPLQ
jgi:hypothetical protein